MPHRQYLSGLTTEFRCFNNVIRFVNFENTLPRTVCDARRVKPVSYTHLMDGNEWLEVSSNGVPLCRIKYNGQFLSNADQNLSDEYRSKIADIQDEISTVREYVGLYEHAPQMKADGVSDYRQLAAVGDTVDVYKRQRALNADVLLPHQCPSDECRYDIPM